jgi:hypothetical protein
MGSPKVSYGHVVHRNKSPHAHTHIYRVSQKLLCSKVPRTTLLFFLQQMLEMSPTGLKTRLDTAHHCATGVLSCCRLQCYTLRLLLRTGALVCRILQCTATFGTLCIYICEQHLHSWIHSTGRCILSYYFFWWATFAILTEPNLFPTWSNRTFKLGVRESK